MKKILAIFSLLVFVAACSRADNMQTAVDALNAKNYKKAFDCFMVEAKKGNADAMNTLANLYAAGLGTEKNYEKAIYWYNEAIKKGNSLAYNNLASMYQLGQGVKQDYQKAVALLNRASSENLAIAQAILGTIYYTGQLGQKINYNKAFRLIESSALNGFPGAQMSLGTLYMEGKAVKQNYSKAYMWYCIAYKNGEEKASEGMEQTSIHLTKQQIAEAEQQAEEWMKNHKEIDTAFTNVQNGVTIPLN